MRRHLDRWLFALSLAVAHRAGGNGRETNHDARRVDSTRYGRFTGIDAGRD